MSLCESGQQEVGLLLSCVEGSWCQDRFCKLIMHAFLDQSVSTLSSKSSRCLNVVIDHECGCGGPV